jgi:hypothetical protein
MATDYECSLSSIIAREIDREFGMEFNYEIYENEVASTVRTILEKNNISDHVQYGVEY